MMSEIQNFHGHVGQVAGGDIVNAGANSGTLWDDSIPVLQGELRRCKAKLFDARRRHFLNWPLGLTLAALGAGMWFLLSGNFANPNAIYWLMGWAAVLLTGTWWLDRNRRGTAMQIAIYKRRIATIEFILQDRI
ncbi:hypothetical protein O9570_17140 [Achromobacter xylosoxidans]|jgi:hypothetical protein|uniref:Uncharacterized protein n=2 Tax=Alcaligenes xylosoxydans xylosoxydans TaxID=85698 RepID=A0A9X3L2Z9_ALCXX|nr:MULTISPECIES: hypothetical protein [Alcaligenaceae]MCZ8403181.1 hypothetical protein [Achromobacter xylosoxidans]